MLSGDTPVFAEVGVRSQSMTSRSASPNGSGRISAASASEKMALLTPMPSARVSAATNVKPGAEINCRTANRMSLCTSSSPCLSRISASSFDIVVSQTYRPGNSLAFRTKKPKPSLLAKEL